jgi:hypothetical protein
MIGRTLARYGRARLQAALRLTGWLSILFVALGLRAQSLRLYRFRRRAHACLAQ